MLKFIHKDHINKDPKSKRLVIYYNLSDVVLGFLLIVLVSFFIYNYLELNLFLAQPKAINTFPNHASTYPARTTTKKK